MKMVVDGKARASRKAVLTGQNSEKSRNIQKQPSAAMAAHASEAPARLRAGGFRMSSASGAAESRAPIHAAGSMRTTLPMSCA